MKITDGLCKGAVRFSFEFFPPKTEGGVNNLYETIGQLRPVDPLYVSVTYGAGGGTKAFTADLSAHVKNQIGVESMSHLTCASHTRTDVEEILGRLQDAGIENVLALRGDPPNGGVQNAPHDFAHASDLIAFIKKRYSFCVAAACYPEGHPESPNLEKDVEYLKAKVDAGADFLITQLFFDAEVYFRFMDRVRAAGITVPVIPGLMPVTSVSQIERFTSLCGATIPKTLLERLHRYANNPAAVTEVGILWSTAQSLWLINGGAPGIHFYTLNRSHSTRIICERLSFVLNLSRYL